MKCPHEIFSKELVSYQIILQKIVSKHIASCRIYHLRTEFIRGTAERWCLSLKKPDLALDAQDHASTVGPPNTIHEHGLWKSGAARRLEL